MHIDLTDRTAIVTGSTGGIGLAIAKGLARAGARVVVVGRREDSVQAAKQAGVHFDSIYRHPEYKALKKQSRQSSVADQAAR